MNFSPECFLTPPVTFLAFFPFPASSKKSWISRKVSGDVILIPEVSGSQGGQFYPLGDILWCTGNFLIVIIITSEEGYCWWMETSHAAKCPAMQRQSPTTKDGRPPRISRAEPTRNPALVYIMFMVVSQNPGEKACTDFSIYVLKNVHMGAALSSSKPRKPVTKGALDREQEFLILNLAWIIHRMILVSSLLFSEFLSSFVKLMIWASAC